MFRSKFIGVFFFIMLQCCILQLKAGAGSEFKTNELKNFRRIFTDPERSKPGCEITPNHFKGTDTERIKKAINAAKGRSNKVVIPMHNARGGNIRKIDRAILLPSTISPILDNCIIQLSDICRDNMFRSDNSSGAKLIIFMRSIFSVMGNH